MQLKLSDLHLPLRHPFTIALGTTTIQHNLLVELTQDGLTGYGEGASADAFPEFTADSMRAALEKARPHIERETLDDPAALWDRLLPVLGHNRFALCALDEAAHDLWGKLQGAPVWKLWGLTLRDMPLSDYTIGIDPIEKMIAKMKEFDGWPIYKIKLGTKNDLEIIRELRRHTQAIFRVDANTSWTAEQAIANAPELKKLGVEFIEQPLRPADWEGMRRVYRESALPVLADESCLVARPPHDRARPAIGAKDHGRLHVREQHRHQRHRPAFADARLCGHGRRGLAGERRRQRRSFRKRTRHFS
jgi:L-alanine-DL-glutamate epimerase-like enolase superfamily enzyme